MNRRSKAVIGIEAKSDVRKGVRDAEQQLNKLKAPLANIQKLAGMAFAGFSAYAIVNGIKSVAQASAKQEAIFNDLRASVENLGISYDAVSSSLKKTFRHLQDITTYGDTDSAKVLTDLITLTGNYNASLKALPLVLDMAASGQFDVRTAARYMAMALKGNITMLGRYIPELRASSSAFLTNATDAQKAEYAIKMLQKHFGGRAQAEIHTTAGSYKQLSNEFGDLKEAIGDLINEPLADFFHMAATAVREFTSLITPEKKQYLNSYSGTIQHNIETLDKYIQQLKRHQTDLKTAQEAINVMTAAGYSQTESLKLKNLEKELAIEKQLLSTAKEMDRQNIKNAALKKTTGEAIVSNADYQKRLEAYRQQQLKDAENFKKLQMQNEIEQAKQESDFRQQQLDELKDTADMELGIIQQKIEQRQQIEDAAFQKEMQQDKIRNEQRKEAIMQQAQEMTAIFATFWQDVGTSMGTGEPLLKRALKDSLNMIINYLEKKYLAVEASATLEALLSGGTLSFTSLAKVAAGYAALEAARVGINSFHTGGIVPGYGNDIPAIVQGGERIISKEIYRERRVQIENAISGSDQNNQRPIVHNEYHIQALDVDSFRKYMRRRGYDVIQDDANLGYL